MDQSSKNSNQRHRGFGRGNFRSRRGNFNRRGGFGSRGQSNHRKPTFHSSKPKDTPGKRLSEAEIFVTEYISDLAGITGVLKSRYADFQVSEINKKGQVAKLTDTQLPPLPEVPADASVVQREDNGTIKYRTDILPLETWQDINSLLDSGAEPHAYVEIDVTGLTKEDRTVIHDIVKMTFGSDIAAHTVILEPERHIKFTKYKVGDRTDQRCKWPWPAEYLHFIVYKENCATMEAVQTIAAHLRMSNIKPSNIGYAGTKDRRGKTTQWFCIRKMQPSRLVEKCGGLREITLGNFTFTDKVLKLGDLMGNKFRIALRNVTSEDDHVEKAFQHLKDFGFVNYYGLQRFGTRPDTPTYSVGLKILQGNYKEAINAILEPANGPTWVALTKYKETGDAEAALSNLSKYVIKNTAEGKMLQHLAMSPKDLIGAILKVPRNMCLLYLHSYQSLVWNRCVSERFRRFGRKPAAGDLVLHDSVSTDIEVDEDFIEDNAEEEENSASKTDDIEPAKSVEPVKDSTVKEGTPKIPVKVLTEDDIAGEKYTLFDILMPLPGFNIEYPPNMVDYYRTLLENDGLKLEMRHKFKNFSLSGAYRHMVVRPSDINWELVRYNDPYGDLILSDIDELKKKTSTAIVPDGTYKAVILTMTLPASCYATMALREVLKVDTSGDFQAAQNNYHKSGDETQKRKLDFEGEVDAKKTKEDDDGSELLD